MNNLRSLFIPIIDYGLRIIGAASLAAIAIFLAWWLL